VFPELRIAAGNWGDECSGFSQSLEAADLWIPLPKGVRSGQRAFVARVNGHSMEPLVPDGSWCVFGPPPEGTRQGKNLIVWHSSIKDPEGLGQYTLKRWRSSKHVPSDESHEAWQHTEILLEPLNSAYDEIRISPEKADSVKVVAELMRVL
jgi:phage repressor protein C with HTH and peptisase S24 domain